jgi:uncharacterized protein YlaI
MATLNNVDKPDEILSQDEEENFVRENLAYIDKFLTNIRVREESLPSDSQIRVSEFKKNWAPFLASTSDAIGRNVVSNKATGAISKRQHVQARGSADGSDLSSEDSDRTVSHTDHEPESDSSSEEIVPKKIVHRKPRVKKNAFNLKDWRSVLEKLDTRKVPDIEKFSEESGMSLRKYLQKFEDYCTQNFKGSRDSWIGELERHLQDRALKAFRSLHDVSDTYDCIKEKICDWLNDLRDVRKEEYKALFKKARPDITESMYLYSTRLEQLYKRAYPKRNTTTSRELREKFVTSIPKRFRMIVQSQIMSYQIKEEPVQWKMLQKCARHFDIEQERKRNRDESSSECEMAVNLCGGKRMKDATMQHDSTGYSQPGNVHGIRKLSTLERTGRTVPEHQHAQRPERARWYAQVNPPVSAGNNEACAFCGRMGHTSNECRSRLKQCFVCGSANHFIRDCPNRHEYRNRPVQTRFLPQPASRVSQTTNRRNSFATGRDRRPLNLIAPTNQR